MKLNAKEKARLAELTEKKESEFLTEAETTELEELEAKKEEKA